MEPSQLLIATRNENKLSELQQILSDLSVALIDLQAFPGIPEIAETGKSFAENAQLKAAGYAIQTGRLTMADDSGLEVDALDGEPGIFSARYLGESVSYPVRMQTLLERLATIKGTNRSARFVCAIAIADRQGTILYTSVGTCEGQIAEEARGSRGFGYDPIFIPRGYDLTFGELDSHLKNQISHRARALRAARAYLQSLTAPLYAD